MPAHTIAQMKMVEDFLGYASGHSEPQSMPFAVHMMAPMLVILALVKLTHFYLLIAHLRHYCIRKTLACITIKASESAPSDLVNIDPSVLTTFNWHGLVIIIGINVDVGEPEVFVKPAAPADDQVVTNIEVVEREAKTEPTVKPGPRR
ncbi:hypothetical protein DXG01_004780 [Tephrocybe rancida]|nr:hypothetical protein DXG01_004780 [Tephrocybe rancida]